jgi:ABC-2 type transport system ATP-binding protein
MKPEVKVMNVIETHHLTKIFGDRYISLNGADLVVPPGMTCGLIGPNGAGKTTTIRLLLGLQSPTAGRVEIFGEPMTPNAVHLRRRIGYLPTNPRFPRDMTPIAYLDFIGKLCGLPREDRKPRLAALLRAVGLLSASAQKVKGFSTGMVTRLGIAASLINDPELLIWDEPTSGLDPEGRKYTIDLIRELSQSKTLLVSSHNLGDIKQVCNYIAILSEGKLIFNGPVQEMTRFTRSNAIELELNGDLDAVTRRIKADYPDLRWEKERSVLRLVFEDVSEIAPGLVQALQAVADCGATLASINSLQDEMVDAFIRLVEEERGHGFSRIFRDSQASDDVSGVNGKRSGLDD